MVAAPLGVGVWLDALSSGVGVRRWWGQAWGSWASTLPWFPPIEPHFVHVLLDELTATLIEKQLRAHTFNYFPFN